MIGLPNLEEQKTTDNLEKLVKDTAESLDNPTLPELVEKLVKEKRLKFQEASRAVYVFWKKGGLKLSEPNPPSNLLSFTFNLESLWFWAITALVALTMIVVFSVNASPLIYARYILGGVFILFLPGFMLISALYPRGGELDGLEKLALSIGLSLAIVPLVGLMLNYTPWGITLTPIMVSLAVLAEALAAGALVRKYRYYRLSSE
ncbi:MAG: DUF1616 domain-containing protein [Candidatus Bathyarchaeota archaeon]|nr:DUF1616 domain-containing protein [Candidatus Bathyarchaeota archaeon]